MAYLRFKKAYLKVFDAQGRVRPCGRDTCIALIEECKKIKPNTDFGDVNTGYMNIEAIKALRKEV